MVCQKTRPAGPGPAGITPRHHCGENVPEASLAHIASMMTNKQHSHVPVKIQNVAATALIDSGNLWRTAISKQFS